MKLSAEEKQERRLLFSQMTPAEKTDYIFTYYKLPIFLAIIAVVILISTIVRIVTHKNMVLYTAGINVVMGEEMEKALSAGFITAYGYNPAKQDVYLYENLYLSDNPLEEYHSYSYASEMKILGATETKKLDLVLMNHESYDLLSSKGYLLDLSLLAKDYPLLSAVPADAFVSNDVLISDNSLEVTLNEEIPLEQDIVSCVNGLCLNDSPVLKSAALDGDVYLGVVANSPRIDAAVEYMCYLMGNERGTGR